MSESYKSLGQWLKSSAGRQGLSTEDVARKLNQTPSYVKDVFSGTFPGRTPYDEVSRVLGTESSQEPAPSEPPASVRTPETVVAPSPRVASIPKPRGKALPEQGEGALVGALLEKLEQMHQSMETMSQRIAALEATPPWLDELADRMVARVQGVAVPAPAITGAPMVGAPLQSARQELQLIAVAREPKGVMFWRSDGEAFYQRLALGHEPMRATEVIGMPKVTGDELEDLELWEPTTR